MGRYLVVGLTMTLRQFIIQYILTIWNINLAGRNLKSLLPVLWKGAYFMLSLDNLPVLSSRQHFKLRTINSFLKDSYSFFNYFKVYTKSLAKHIWCWLNQIHSQDLSICRGHILSSLSVAFQHFSSVIAEISPGFLLLFIINIKEHFQNPFNIRQNLLKNQLWSLGDLVIN